VLKYDFKEIGPVVVDKSGHGNLGRLKPVYDPPRRQVISWFPLKVVLIFDGKDDLVKTPYSPSIEPGIDEWSVFIRTRTIEQPNDYASLVWWGEPGGPLYNIRYDRQPPRLRMIFQDKEGNIADLRPGGVVPMDQENVIGFTYDGNVLEGWINGESVGTADGKSVYNVSGRFPLILGRQPAMERFLKGAIHWVKMWSKAISEDKIKEL